MMKNKMNRSLVLLASFILSSIIVSYAQSAEEVLSKMDALMLAPKDKQSHFKMTLLDRNGRGKVREADLFQKGTGERLTRYTKPENQAGISTLFLPEGKGVMWIYMPALGNPKKISGLANSQAFNNTDFSLEDMASTPFLDRYTPALLESTSSS
jgi:outer membrane lipoprotein-sorting protein